MLRTPRILRDNRAAIAAYTAIMLPVLVAAVGAAIDFANAYLVRERLSRALDAAALAAAGSDLPDEAAIQARVNKFMEANYPEEKIGVAYDIDVTVTGDDIRVSASADYNTMFIHVLGFDTLTIGGETNVRKQVKGVEAVLVLDNTGSMSYTPPGESMENIEALQNAAENFVNIMFAEALQSSDVKIGIVPYANSVRIGTWGLGYKPDDTDTMADNEEYLDNDGLQVDTFVNLPSGVSFTTNSGSATGWFGCVVEHMDNEYYTDAATHVSGSYGQLWSTAAGADSTRCASADTCRGHGWQPSIGNNDPAPQDYEDDYEGPWDIYMYGRVITNNNRCSDLGGGYSNSAANCSSCLGANGRCNSAYCYCKRSAPANSCPRSTVLPLTSNQTSLLDAIGTMQAHGNTQGNAGMTWGYRLISPEAPFTEGAGWDSQYWSKAVIMMTDGDNTMDGSYSYYWASAKNDITVSNTNPKGLNQRFAEVCNALKAKDVLIYTIVFKSENEVSEANKAFYRDCATNASMYYDAPTQESLIDAFSNIARELSNLRITE